MRVWGIDTALVTDDDNVFYLTGYYDYLHMEFGRPTIFIVSENSPSVIITPQIDENSARSLAHCDEISTWNDGMGDEWREKLPNIIKLSKKIGIELDRIPQIVLSYLNSLNSPEKFVNFSEILEELRMIKSQEELQVARPDQDREQKRQPRSLEHHRLEDPEHQREGAVPPALCSQTPQA